MLGLLFGPIAISCISSPGEADEGHCGVETQRVDSRSSVSTCFRRVSINRYLASQIAGLRPPTCDGGFERCRCRFDRNAAARGRPVVFNQTIFPPGIMSMSRDVGGEVLVLRFAGATDDHHESKESGGEWRGVEGSGGEWRGGISRQEEGESLGRERVDSSTSFQLPTRFRPVRRICNSFTS